LNSRQTTTAQEDIRGRQLIQILHSVSVRVSSLERWMLKGQLTEAMRNLQVRRW
jgi:hypothetical protein